MRILYFGSPAEAVPPLTALAQAHEIAFVVTRPDRRRGRGGARGPSPVKAAAGDLGLEVLTPERSGDVVDIARASGAQLGVVVAFGQLLPDALLGALPHGFVNLHFSLLPRWRGAAPVERAILAGDEQTGVCVMAMEAELDTGPVYARRAVPISPRETAGELTVRLVDLGTELLVETLPRIPETTPDPQSGEPTHAPKLSVEEFALDWARAAVDLDRVVRAGNPRPGAWTTVEGRRLKVLRSEPTERAEPGDAGVLDEEGIVATGHGGLRLLEVQPEGARVMPVDAWLAGRRGARTVLGR